MTLANVLRQVRDNRHFDLASVARFAQISPARLKEIESGVREPSFKQLQRLAEAYGVPDYILGAGGLPNLPEQQILDFRKRAPRPARLSPEAMQRIWATEQAVVFTTQIWGALELALPSWSKEVPTGKPNTKIAGLLRHYFDDWFAERRAGLQLSGTADQTFFAGLRIFLEALGIIVRVNDAPADEFLGFFLADRESFGSIFVNRRTLAPKAQLFTLVHEVAHLMINANDGARGGVSDPFKLNNQIEQTCNRFAAEFLAPDEIFRAAVELVGRSDRADVFRFVDSVAQHSLLSKFATAIRLRETDYITQEQLVRWTAARATMTRKQLKDEESDASGETFGAPHAKRIGEVGYLPTYVAKVAVEKKLIDFADVTASISISRGLQDRAFSLAARRMEVAVR
ncbi:ImmA/IrrE family metallo-endopeptidase [Bradyrhizobium elkanii]|uniref:ImmA/IrrE family metallo-endopeptidase n=1 Tax=Bradyrhizobium elkanii TaxID=29448 RepID=A0A4U6RWR7_BRAEL|nr:XRE family transcriptional regulator [Bradyrhizobium elkanii]TKV78931.1 ImmA/IrrE family metallo-endopeptidase [Bradyrhizobium elkanii]